MCKVRGANFTRSILPYIIIVIGISLFVFIEKRAIAEYEVDCNRLGGYVLSIDKVSTGDVVVLNSLVRNSYLCVRHGRGGYDGKG